MHARIKWWVYSPFLESVCMVLVVYFLLLCVEQIAAAKDDDLPVLKRAQEFGVDLNAKEKDSV